MEYIPEPSTFDHDTEEPIPSPPVVDSYSPAPTESTPSAPSGGTSSSRGSKRKTPLVDLIDSQFAHLMTKLDAVTDAMRQGNDNIDRLSSIAAEHNAIFREHVQNWHRHSSVHYSEREIWDMLVELNIGNEDIFDQCYETLCSNQPLVKLLFGMPQDRRLDKLLQVMTRRH